MRATSRSGYFVVVLMSKTVVRQRGTLGITIDTVEINLTRRPH